ncbi:hypothetical protein LEP1GSC021_2492 [Leptospira noguchii str. 1993005606]|uniref:Uncharacterized protein n=1 Tax=Leptospira noguchii str. 2007001578 TaxID=1049974 RepID=A0ABP2T2E6_9LEPT|nr:hypothetical protein LEP1GSC035_0494 [Leptospira noguchii str. 2007001578]EPE82888.1 hypothetical protein LEP1GSC021_2492 [Leptospira noguchii str. 1993005606]
MVESVVLSSFIDPLRICYAELTLKNKGQKFFPKTLKFENRFCLKMDSLKKK